MIEKEDPAPLSTGTGSTKSAAAKPLAPVTDSSGSWAERLISQAGGIAPIYRSPEWDALPANSRAKVAGCVLAAEAWHRHQMRRDEMLPRTTRARITEARRPRPGDHLGGSLPVWGPDHD